MSESDVINAVCVKLNITPDDFRSKDRVQYSSSISRARKMAMLIIVEQFSDKLTKEQMAQLMGDTKTRGTLRWMVQKGEGLYATDAEFKRICDAVKIDLKLKL